MPQLFENYGLEFLSENSDMLMGILGYSVENGKVIKGYYDLPYIFADYYNPEFWITTEKAENGYAIDGFSLHCGNKCIWEVEHTGIDITPKDAGKLVKTIIVSDANREGMLPINIITADVLPGIIKGDKFKVQMVAQPIEISYYENEDALMDSIPETKRGQKWFVAENTLCPVRFLYNHSPEHVEEKKEYPDDDLLLFHATVTKLYTGAFEFNGERMPTFIRCFANTRYGELEFDHSIEQIPEEQRDKIKVGAVISGTCVLSGDVAIYEYENGAIKDYDHDLRLLRHVFQCGDAERLRSVLDDAAKFTSDQSKTTCAGPDEIIGRITHVRSRDGFKCFAYLATVTKSTNNDFPQGEKCLVLSYNNEFEYEALANIKVNNDGMITDIIISTDADITFSVENPPEKPVSYDDLERPDNIVDPIIIRAILFAFIDESLEKEDIIDGFSSYQFFKENSLKMLVRIQECYAGNSEKDDSKAVENAFGYLFAKAVEYHINSTKNKSITVGYHFDEALQGRITQTLPEDLGVDLAEEMESGKIFYKDFEFFIRDAKPDSEAFKKAFVEATVVVQRIGQLSVSNKEKE